MHIWIFSDLHLEMSNWQPPTDMVGKADVVVLAGDVYNPLVASVGWIRDHRKPGGAFEGMEVVLVPGNHEFYHQDVDA